MSRSAVSVAVTGGRCVSIWPRTRPSVPPLPPPRMGTQPRLIDPFVELVEAWLRADVRLKGTVVHERLVAEHGFTGNYQRVKMFLSEAQAPDRRRARGS